ncbi:MAG: hypothetical protein HKN47_19805 [Pirellulaceae bacterium]|nr:hypothetical protein [Pirellulaceae bacterium]
MTRFKASIRLLLYIVLVVAAAFAGYRYGYHEAASLRGGKDVDTAKFVSLAQLDAATNQQPFFYLGSDKNWHYFEVSNIGYYRLNRSEKIPDLARGGGSGVADVGLIWRIVTIRDGKLYVPPSDGLPGGYM